MEPRTVEEALAALARLTNYERTRADGPRAFDLARPAALLQRLGAPHRRLGATVLQVAGSKGKGSTARFADALLRGAGRRTGLFTSPHLEDVRERITVDGEPIPGAAFARCVGTVLEAVDGTTTFFEALLGVACLHFAEQATDAVVLEVGLGGRLDATTAVPTTHTIITGIALEHTEILGATLEAVAAEKAGTIRAGVPVWSGVAPDSAAGAVLARIAAERRAPLTPVPPPTGVVATPRGIAWNGRELPLLGRHQAHNAELAAAALADLPAAALANARQPGCCERFAGSPPVVLDGAHTAESIAAALAAVADHFPGRRPQVVFALAQDKDLDRIAPALANAAGAVWCTRADERRGRPPEQLRDHPALVAAAHAATEPAAALAAAQAAAGAEGVVLVTGSLYLAGALRRLLRTPA